MLWYLFRCFLYFFVLIIRLPSKSTLFPYTTLFRSKGATIWVAKIQDSTQLIGGYNPLDWNGDGIWKSTPDSFLLDRKSTRLNSSHTVISYAVFCLKKKNIVQYKGCNSYYNGARKT